MVERFWNRRSTRRNLLKGAALGGAGLAVAAVLGCGEGETKLTRTKWEQLPALDRLKLMETKGLQPAAYKEITNFDPLPELTLATAQYYCEQTQCLKDPQVMAASVSFLDTRAFLAAIEKEKQITLTLDERARLKEVFEETVRENRRVLVNQTAINNYVQKLVRGEIRLAGGLPRGNLQIKAYETILFHAFTHANIVSQIVEFEPISIRIQGGPNQINLEVDFEKMDRFNLVGHLANSSREYTLHGFNEAMTELTAIIIATRAGDYIAANQRYAGGADLISAINMRAGVSDEEFLKYNNGQLPLEGLLAKWGSLADQQNPDIQRGALAATAIALYVEGFGDVPEARSSIANLLGITLR